MTAEHELETLFLTHEDLEQALEDTDALVEGARSEREPGATLVAALADLHRRIEDHMTAEERWVFPEVLRAGAPVPLITALTATHQRLRELGFAVLRSPRDLDRASKWLKAFRDHVQYEERSLAHFVQRMRPN